MPEVRAAFDELALVMEEPANLPAQMDAVAVVAEGLVPSTMAVSISLFVDRDRWTLTAIAEDAVVVDEAEDLDRGGTRLEANATGEKGPVEDLADRGGGKLDRHSRTPRGIRSSLTLPLRDDQDRITGALDLYAAEPGAFRGVGTTLAEIFGAQVDELITDADLTFQTREWARQLPDRVSARRKLETAVGVLMALYGWPPEEARSKLREVADRAGIEVAKVAEVVMGLAA